MQMDPELTLAKAKTLTCQKEAIREQQLMLESTTEAQEDPISLIQASPCKTPYSTLCMRCGRGPHPRHQCPTKDVQCHKCKYKGLLLSSVALSQLLKLATSVCLRKITMMLSTSTLLARRMLITGHVAYKSMGSM